MNLRDRFLAYAAEFEKTYADDEWSRLEPFFSEQATYEVRGLAALSGRAEGRQAVFEMIRQTLERFDRRMDRRDLRLTAPPEVTADSVTIHWSVTYGPKDHALKVLGTEVVTYRDGLIVGLEDLYSEDMARSFAKWQQEVTFSLLSKIILSWSAIPSKTVV